MTQDDEIRQEIVEVFHEIYDPEIPASIWELGLVYDLNVENGNVDVLMTLTAPGCPVAGDIIAEVEDKVGAVDGVESVEVELTFDPQWTMDMMTEEARLELGLM